MNDDYLEKLFQHMDDYFKDRNKTKTMEQLEEEYEKAEQRYRNKNLGGTNVGGEK